MLEMLAPICGIDLDCLTEFRLTVSNSIGTGNGVAFTIVGDLAIDDAKNKAGL